MSKAFYALYHLHAQKMFDVLQKKFGIANVYKKTSTLGKLLFKRRPKRDKWNSIHVVYSVPCSEQPDQYIDQIKRKMITRVREHEKSCEGDASGIQPDIQMTIAVLSIMQPLGTIFCSKTPES